jgi:hypothetical protein
MQMTLPQIMILNHAAWVNSQRSDERYKRKREREEKIAAEQKKRDEEDPVVWNGKRLSEMNSDEWAQYYGDAGGIF